MIAEELRARARSIRKRLLRMHYEAKSSHLGTGLSEVDILTFLFGHWLAPEDRFILSKGHGASGLYSTLEEFDRLPKGMIETYYKDNTKLAAHPSPLSVEAIPVATGSLGHGLSVATGMALGARLTEWRESSAQVSAEQGIKKSRKKIVCLISDGECNEGSIWEAILFAAHHQLNNLTVFVDFNGLQGFGRNSEVLNLEPIVDKWKAFGFETRLVDGHDFNSIETAMKEVESSDRPRCLIAKTIKGRGVSFMEDRLEWHYLNLNQELYEKALAEVDKS